MTKEERNVSLASVREAFINFPGILNIMYTWNKKIDILENDVQDLLNIYIIAFECSLSDLPEEMRKTVEEKMRIYSERYLFKR